MVEWLAGNRIRGTSAEKPALGLQSPSVGGWKEVGRTTLESANGSISVASLPDKRYYMTLFSDKGRSASGRDVFIRLNGDNNANYSLRRTNDGGSSQAGVSTSTSYGFWVGNADTTPIFNVGYLSNVNTKEKLWLGHGTCQKGSSACPDRCDVIVKHAQTTNPVDEITATASSGTFDSGSELVVLGWDKDDTHTTNFWEELASVELDATTDELSSGTITAKKYLWVQYYVKKTGTANTRWRFNNDTGSNYSARYSGNDVTDSQLTSQTSIFTHANTSGNAFGNIFIINNSTNHKLGMFNETASNDRSNIAAKWANNAQITEIDLINTDSGGFTSGTLMKIWGHD